MYWNHRIVKTKKDNQYVYGIYEVYYDEDNKPCLRDAEPYQFPTIPDIDKTVEDFIQELKEYFDLVLKAFNKPILTDDDFLGSKTDNSKFTQL